MAAKKNPAVSHKKAAQEQRKAEERERNRLHYQKNKVKIIKRVKERRQEKRESIVNQRRPTRRTVKEIARKKNAKHVRNEARAKVQARKEKIREQTRKRVRKYQDRKEGQSKNVTTFEKESLGYANRMAKKWRTDKVKASLPATPPKKAAIIKTIMNSPRTRQILENERMIKKPSEEKEINVLKALASDISEEMEEVKRSRSNKKLAAFTAFKLLAFGKNVKKGKAKKSLSKLLNIHEKSISKAIERREKVLKGDLPRWLYTKRKLREDAISEEDGKIIYGNWTSVASRPTGDKKDVVKKRTGKQQYIQLAKHVLEKTQTEAYMDLKSCTQKFRSNNENLKT